MFHIESENIITLNRSQAVSAIPLGWKPAKRQRACRGMLYWDRHYEWLNEVVPCIWSTSRRRPGARRRCSGSVPRRRSCLPTGATTAYADRRRMRPQGRGWPTGTFYIYPDKISVFPIFLNELGIRLRREIGRRRRNRKSAGKHVGLGTFLSFRLEAHRPVQDYQWQAQFVDMEALSTA